MSAQGCSCQRLFSDPKSGAGKKGGEGESGGVLDIPPFMIASLKGNFRNRGKKIVAKEKTVCRKRRQRIPESGMEGMKRRGRNVEEKLMLNRKTKRLERL